MLFDDGDYNNGKYTVDSSHQSLDDDVDGGDEEDDDGDNGNVAELLHHR